MLFLEYSKKYYKHIGIVNSHIIEHIDDVQLLHDNTYNHYKYIKKYRVKFFYTIDNVQYYFYNDDNNTNYTTDISKIKYLISKFKNRKIIIKCSGSECFYKKRIYFVILGNINVFSWRIFS